MFGNSGLENSELQGNYNSETDNIKIRHGKKMG